MALGCRTIILEVIKNKIRNHAEIAGSSLYQRVFEGAQIHPSQGLTLIKRQAGTEEYRIIILLER